MSALDASMHWAPKNESDKTKSAKEKQIEKALEKYRLWDEKKAERKLRRDERSGGGDVNAGKKEGGSWWRRILG